MNYNWSQDDIESVVVSEEDIRAHVKRLGREISRDYAGKPLLLVSVLKGAVVFLADLMREIDIPYTIDFMSVSSYQDSTQSSGVVRIVKDLDVPLQGCDVLLIEDILDSGRTLRYIVDTLTQRWPNSVRICTLFDKPARRTADVMADYKGCDIPDKFVVGYGLDYAEKYRGLRYLGALKESVL